MFEKTSIVEMIEKGGEEMSFGQEGEWGECTVRLFAK